MKVTLVSTPDLPTCGVGTYTGELRRRLEELTAINHVSIPIEGVNPYPFIQAAITAGWSDSDVVHVQHEYGLFGPRSVLSWVFFPLLFLLTRLRNLPVVLTIHEAWSSATIESGPYLVKRLYVRAMNYMLAGVADELVFLSDSVKEEFERTVELNHATRISHGVAVAKSLPSSDDPEATFDIDPEQNVVVEPGYVSHNKGQDVFIRMAERFADVQFLVAGGIRSDRDSAFYETIKDESPENVIITGVLNDTEFHDAFQVADAIVLPYRKSSQSGIFNWAAAHEVPVAGSRCTYFRSLADRYDCIKLFDINDEDEVAQAIERILYDEDLRDRLQEGLKTFKEDESFEQVSKRHVQLYSTLIHQ